MPQEKDTASDCTSFATALGHAAPAAAQPASFPASATAPHTLTGEIDALKAVSKAVRDLDSLNLTQRKLFDRIEHTHNNISSPVPLLPAYSPSTPPTDSLICQSTHLKPQLWEGLPYPFPGFRLPWHSLVY